MWVRVPPWVLEGGDIILNIHDTVAVPLGVWTIFDDENSEVVTMEVTKLDIGRFGYDATGFVPISADSDKNIIYRREYWSVTYDSRSRG